MDQNSQENQQPVPVGEPTKVEVATEQPTPAVEPVAEVAATEPTEKTAIEPEKLDEKPKKTKTPAIVALVIVLSLLVGVGAWCFFNRPGDDQPIAEDQTSEEESSLALKGNGLSDFDLTFLKMEDGDENIVYSPLSMKYALGMLAEGADGDSKTQITNILGEYKPKAYINSANRSLANAMFVKTGSMFADVMDDAFVDALETKYNAEVIYDSFASPDNANGWVSDETLGIIQNMFNEEVFNPKTEVDFVLLNALAIDMNWNNQLQCAGNVNRVMPCMNYYIRYDHEKYEAFIETINADYFSKLLFNNESNVSAAEIGASANRYDIINTLGEDYIRETVQNEYEKYIEENGEDEYFDIDEYISELAANNGKVGTSTDFYFYNSDDEKVFAKDLKEYDGSVLEYVGFMPKNEDLDTYINGMTAEKASALIGNLKDAADINSYKEGVVTRLHAYIPFFKYEYNMENFKSDLEKLGVTGAFSKETANLYKMVDVDEETTSSPYIMHALHKAAIDFSNDGIKAAAVTGLAGGMGMAIGFDYTWDVPIEEIDLTFDKPFFFLIRDKETGEVWFVGKVENLEA